jgi:hypothetical protein
MARTEMMAERFIRILNWEQFQHYKDRNPPWIKLHRELLTSRTWLTASDASRVLAIACMVLASETGNKIPLDVAYIRRLAYLNQDPDFGELIASQFIEIVDQTGTASTLLAHASKLHANARPETETETEKRQRKEKRTGAHAPSRTRAFVPPSIDELKTYCEERRNAVDPQYFLDHYSANGWKVGRNPMKDWKATVRTWEKNGVNTGQRRRAIPESTKTEQLGGQMEYSLPSNLDEEAGRECWAGILREIEPRMNRHSYETWIRPGQPAGLLGDTLFVKLPAPQFAHVGVKYETLLREVSGGLRVQFVIPREAA